MHWCWPWLSIVYCIYCSLSAVNILQVFLAVAGGRWERVRVILPQNCFYLAATVWEDWAYCQHVWVPPTRSLETVYRQAVALPCFSPPVWYHNWNDARISEKCWWVLWKFVFGMKLPYHVFNFIFYLYFSRKSPLRPVSLFQDSPPVGAVEGRMAHSNGWNGVNGMVSNTSQMRFPCGWYHSIDSIPAIISSRPPLNSLHWSHVQWGKKSMWTLWSYLDFCIN